MFNYASNGKQTNVGDTDSEYVTNGLYSMEDEDGMSYYFRGNVTNNNVQFGEYQEDYYVYEYNYLDFQTLESCQEYNSSCSESNKVKLASAGDKMYWKIVRVNGDGSLRLIYNGTSTTPDNSDLAHSYAVGYTPYNLERNASKYTGYTYDRDTNETDSFIKREIDTWYLNALGNTEYDSMVTAGRFCNDTSGLKEETDYGFPDNVSSKVFASYDRLGQDLTNFAKPNSPTLKCPTTTESYGGSYRLKAGLITADELALAGECFGLYNDGYLNSGYIYYWSMTPSSYVNSWTVWSEYDGRLLEYSVNLDAGVRPVINVTADNAFTSGDGTVDSPYVIS